MGVPINNVTRRVVYAASGTGPYAFTFEILAAGDIAVYRDDTLLTLTTDYTVTIASNGTGSITLTAAPTGATQIAIVGNRTIQRTTDFVTGGDFFANTLNDELDQQTIFAQQNAEGLQRALIAPQTDPTTIDMTLPRAADRANKTLAFDANGDPTLGISAADVANAVTYATNAANSATAAAASASSASSSASSASSSASTATTQASNASTSASSASTSATNASNSASSASTSASNASTSATNAANSASAASTSATNAASSASSASTSASNASTSATNAANSATAAATSETNAAASAAAAATALDNFDDRYLGAKTADPTVDNDGNALVTGALYYRSTAPVGMKVYDGSQWLEASAAQQSLLVTYEFVATAGQTTFSGTDANGVTLSYVANSISVLLNGVALRPGDDYTATNGTSIVLTSAAALNDELMVIAFAVFSVANTYTQSQVDGFLAGKLDTTAGAVSATNLASNAVTTVKITDANVTTAKIADNNVTYAKLASDVQGALYGFKNRIINGAMVIDQRNAGAAQNNLASGWVYTVDRWEVYSNNSSRFNSQQNKGSVTPPAGFKNYLGVSVNTGYTPSASDYNILAQPIEGFNTADLGFGASGASTVTLSFWVYTSVTGTHSGFLANSTLVTAYPFTFTVSSANTWTQISVTITGSTSGTWVGATNGIGLYVGFNLGNGSNFQTASANAWNSSAAIQPSSAVSIVGTSSATFYITGVQLEKGSTATSFDYRPYGTELALCQRYYYKFTSGVAFGSYWSNADVFLTAKLPVTMRTNPSTTLPSGTMTNFIDIIGAGTTTPGSFGAYGYQSTEAYNFYALAASGSATGRPGAYVGSFAIQLSAEL